MRTKVQCSHPRIFHQPSSRPATQLNSSCYRSFHRTKYIKNKSRQHFLRNGSTRWPCFHITSIHLPYRHRLGGTRDRAEEQAPNRIDRVAPFARRKQPGYSQAKLAKNDLHVCLYPTLAGLGCKPSFIVRLFGLAIWPFSSDNLTGPFTPRPTRRNQARFRQDRKKALGGTRRYVVQ